MAGIRSIVAVAVATIGVLTMSACAAETIAAPKSSTTTTPAPSPSVDQRPEVDTIVIAGDGLHLQHGSETVDVLDLRSDPAVTIEALTKVVGSPTAVTEAPATNHFGPTTVTDFDGLKIYVEHYDEPGTPDYLVRPAWSVSFTTAAVGAVQLRTTAGLAVGGPFAEAKSAVSESEGWVALNNDGTKFGRTLVEKAPGSPDSAVAAGGVMVLSYADGGGAISSIVAPLTLSAP